MLKTKEQVKQATELVKQKLIQDDVDRCQTLIDNKAALGLYQTLVDFPVYVEVAQILRDAGYDVIVTNPYSDLTKTFISVSWKI